MHGWRWRRRRKRICGSLRSERSLVVAASMRGPSHVNENLWRVRPVKRIADQREAPQRPVQLSFAVFRRQHKGQSDQGPHSAYLPQECGFRILDPGDLLQFGVQLLDLGRQSLRFAPATAVIGRAFRPAALQLFPHPSHRHRKPAAAPPKPWRNPAPHSPDPSAPPPVTPGCESSSGRPALARCGAGWAATTPDRLGQARQQARIHPIVLPRDWG